MKAAFLLPLLLSAPAHSASVGCGETPSVESLMAALGPKLLDASGGDRRVVADPLTSYYVCSALTEGNPALCAELSKVDRAPAKDPSRRDKTLAETCRMEYDEDRMIRGFLTGASDAVTLCEVNLRQLRGKPLFKPGRLRPACEDLTKNWSNPALACKHLRREFAVSPKDAGMEDCEAELGVANGERSACAAGDFPDRVRHCLDFAAYRRAREGKEPDLCLESGICRALMGQARSLACRGYAEKVVAPVCAGAPPK